MKMSAWKCSGSMFRVSRFFHMVRMKRRRRMMKRVWVWKIGRWVGRLRWFSAIWRRRGLHITLPPVNISFHLHHHHHPNDYQDDSLPSGGGEPPPCTSFLQPGTSFHLSTYHSIFPLSSSHVSWTIICPCQHVKILASSPYKGGEMKIVAEGFWLGKGFDFLYFWISMLTRFRCSHLKCELYILNIMAKGIWRAFRGGWLAGGLRDGEVAWVRPIWGEVKISKLVFGLLIDLDNRQDFEAQPTERTFHFFGK